MPYEDVWEDIVQIVLSEKNAQHFVNVLDKAKEKYKEETEKREREMVYVPNWNIPETLSFGSEYKKVETKKSIMQPFYSDERWKTEAAFIDFLEKSPNVEWWFKNGDRDATFFAVPYEDNGEQKPFYIDFIVKLKDGRIGLFDTKAGLTKQVASPKIDGLYKYIQNENKKGGKLFGGIVANTERNYRGRWVYFDRESKDFKDNSFENWTDLIL
jgi:type III restriction enzyme